MLPFVVCRAMQSHHSAFACLTLTYPYAMSRHARYDPYMPCHDVYVTYDVPEYMCTCDMA
jgi:hypothetical protein